jgi:hypothetical protein
MAELVEEVCGTAKNIWNPAALQKNREQTERQANKDYKGTGGKFLFRNRWHGDRLEGWEEHGY